MFFYVKNDHIEQVPAMKEYIEMFLNTEIIGEDGLLSEIGLIPMEAAMIESSLSKASAKETLEINHLEEDSLRISGL